MMIFWPGNINKVSNSGFINECVKSLNSCCIMIENSLRWVSNKGRRGRSESFINTLLILKFALVLPHKTEC